MFAMKHIFLLFALVGFFSASAQTADDPYLLQAKKLLKKTPVIDTHVDFPYSLVENREWYKPGYTALALKHPIGDFDYERAVKGSLYGPFMSIYIPARYQKEKGRAKELADSLIGMVHAICSDYPRKFAMAYRAADFEKNYRKKRISLPMGMENGAPIENLGDLVHFHKRGIRYITLAHSRDNQICDSSYDTTMNTHGGLSDFGREVVRHMNRIGMMVDVSHLTDESIWDILEITTKPVIATHSACRHFTPGYERNLPDTLIRAIARNNGVIQVPFSHYFLSAHSREVFQNIQKMLKDKGLDDHTPEGKRFVRDELAKSDISVRDVADHIDHIKNLVGIDHIGLGGDFDGVGLALPPDLADVSMYPNLIAELLRRGYSKADIQKICYKNTLRVWRANEQ